MVLFFDTSALYGLFDKDEPKKEKLSSFFKNSRDRNDQFVITNFIVDELLTLARARAGIEDSIRIGKMIRESRFFKLHRVSESDEEEAWKIFSTHTDKHYSFTDCTSFVVMNRLGIKKAVALDQHFAQYGFEVAP